MRISGLWFYFKSPDLSWRVPLIAHDDGTKSLRTVEGATGKKNEGQP